MFEDFADVYHDWEELYNDPNGLGCCPAAFIPAMAKLGHTGKVEKLLDLEEKVRVSSRT